MPDAYRCEPCSQVGRSGDFDVGVDGELGQGPAFGEGVIEVERDVTVHGKGIGRNRPDEVLITGAGPGQDEVLVGGVDGAGGGQDAAAGEGGFRTGGGGQPHVAKSGCESTVIRDGPEGSVGLAGVVDLEAATEARINFGASAGLELYAA